jgi:diaminopimelate decarboxylase
VKSNSFPGIKHISRRATDWMYRAGRLALNLGCEGIIFSGPGKTDEELGLAARNHDRVTLLLDSGGELDRLAGLLEEISDANGPTKVGFRTRGLHHGIWEKKFGVSLDELTSLFQKALSTPGIEPEGIQFHTSWNMGPDAQIKMIKMVGSFIRKRLPEDLWRKLSFLDIGGGYWPESGEWLNAQNTLKGKLIQFFHPEHEFELNVPSTIKPIDHFARRFRGSQARRMPLERP